KCVPITVQKIYERKKMMMKKIRLYHLLSIPLFAVLYASSLNAGADSGVLIATDIGRQDDSTLSLHSMKVDVLIDNQHAYVKVEQIFINHVSRTLEGQYQFDLPNRAIVADFAVWDGLT